MGLWSRAMRNRLSRTQRRYSNFLIGISFSSTVILQVVVFPLAVFAVIVAVPFLIAVTTQKLLVLFIAATLSLLVDQDTASVTISGSTLATR